MTKNISVRPLRRGFLRAGLAPSGWLARRRMPARRLADLDHAVEADVCVLGTGPAGALLAQALVARGISTLLVESGPARRTTNPDPRLAALGAYASRGELTYPVASTRFRGAGGTSNLWAGNCPRMHPRDFEPNAYTPPAAAWPIRYVDLEPYYVGAEAALRVDGVDTHPFAPPNAPPQGGDGGAPTLRRLLDRMKREVQLCGMPRAAPAGQPLRIADSHLPAFCTSPHGTLLCGATATRILCDAAAVTGIVLQGFDQPQRTVGARVYVIACGGIETPRLLLLSRCPAFPDGIGNRYGLVGGCFMDHPTVAIGTATIPGRWNPFAPLEQTRSEQFFTEAKQRGLGGVRIGLRTERRWLDRRHPLASAQRSLGAARHLQVEFRALIEMEPSTFNRVTLDETRRDPFCDPGTCLSVRFSDNDRRTVRYAEELMRALLTEVGAEHIRVETGPLCWENHHMGTCRMGDDPCTSVVDRDLRVHGVDNLYVVGSAPFVTSGVSNPTLTIAALALRLADQLTRRLAPAAALSRVSVA